MRFKLFLTLSIFCIFGCKENSQKIPDNPKKSNLIIAEPADSTLKNELELIAVEDQTMRFLLPEVTKKFGRASDERRFVWSLIHRQDSICLNKTVKILNEYGWLGKSRVGSKANQAIWLVIQHADLEKQQKYLPLLRNSVEKGESEGWHLAFLEDRILMRTKKKQIYGSQTIWDKTISKYKIYPIEDVKNVNKRREKIGLEPIEEDAMQNGYILDQK